MSTRKKGSQTNSVSKQQNLHEHFIIQEKFQDRKRKIVIKAPTQGKGTYYSLDLHDQLFRSLPTYTYASSCRSYTLVGVRNSNMEGSNECNTTSSYHYGNKRCRMLFCFRNEREILPCMKSISKKTTYQDQHLRKGFHWQKLYFLQHA